MARSTTRLVHTTGLHTITAVLAGLPAEMRSTIIAAGVTAGAKPMVIAAKRYANRSRRTGALREAIGSITRKYPQRATAVAVVGVRKGYYRRGKKIKPGQGGDSPSHYAHLVEFGHHAVARRAGTSIRKGNAIVVGWVPAKPFMRPAFITSQAAVAAALTKGVASGVRRTRNKLIRTGAHTS